jgi:hypothetical protein
MGSFPPKRSVGSDGMSRREKEGKKERIGGIIQSFFLFPRMVRKA